jgi:LysR family carnitine catabolism transcriptional activator
MSEAIKSEGVPLSPSYNATIRHLRAFLSVARQRSFTRASRELNLSQPSLTITIQQLEDIVGGALFDRTTRNVTLTPEGHDFFPLAQRLVDDFDITISNVRLTASSRNGCIRIATVHSVATKIMPRILDGFLAHHPGLRVQIREGNSAEVRRIVQRNEVDVGYASKGEEEAELSFHPVFRDQLGLFARHDHPLLKRGDTLSWQDLADYDFVGLTPDTATGPILDQIGYLPQSIRVPKYEVSTNPTLWALLENGLGITTAPALAGEYLDNSNLKFRGLKEPVAWRTVYRVARVGRALPRMAQELVDAIEMEVKRLTQGHERIELIGA